MDTSHTRSRNTCANAMRTHHHLACMWSLMTVRKAGRCSSVSSSSRACSVEILHCQEHTSPVVGLHASGTHALARHSYTLKVWIRSSRTTMNKALNLSQHTRGSVGCWVSTCSIFMATRTNGSLSILSGAVLDYSSVNFIVVLYFLSFRYSVVPVPLAFSQGGS